MVIVSVNVHPLLSIMRKGKYLLRTPIGVMNTLPKRVG